ELALRAQAAFVEVSVAAAAVVRQIGPFRRAERIALVAGAAFGAGVLFVEREAGGRMLGIAFDGRRKSVVSPFMIFVARRALLAVFLVLRVRAQAGVDALLRRGVAAQARRIGDALERHMALVALGVQLGVRRPQWPRRSQALDEVGARRNCQ